MKATHSEDLEFLRRIRGCYGSRRMWSVEYEFTGEEIIERRGGRIKQQMRIGDIVDTQVSIHPYQMTLKTGSSKMVMEIMPALKEVIMKQAEADNAKLGEAERERLEKISREVVSRYKWANFIGMIVLIVVIVVVGLLVRWLMAKI